MSQAPITSPVSPSSDSRKSWNVASILTAAAALLTVVAFFLPYMSVGAEYRSMLSSQPDLEVGLGLTLGNLADLSLFDLARMVANVSELGLDATYSTVLLAVLITVVALPAIALIFALFRKPIPVILFSALALALALFLNGVASESFSASDDIYGAGIGQWLYLAGAAAAIVFAVWTLVLRRRAKGAQVAA